MELNMNKYQKTKTFLLSKLMLAHLILLFTSNAFAQKPFIAKSESNWAQDSITSNISYTIYLVGDAGEPIIDEKTSCMALLKNHLTSANQNSSVIFLGDNIYPNGMVEENSPERHNAEMSIDNQLKTLTNYEGNVFFIPGNHDWARWTSDGWEGVKREEQYIEDKLNRGNVFNPDNGCPGPAEIHLNDSVVLIIIDTQWWLHAYDKPHGEKDSCSINNELDFISELTSVIQNNRDKKIIVTGHHPMFSNGNHGGYFTPKDHLFPLTSLSPKLYIPLPVIGSAYPFYRKRIGNIQDINNPRYQLLKEKMLGAFELHDNLIYAAGHEHNLQYFENNNQHYIVSGSGSKVKYAAKRNGASFTYAKQGFSKVLYLTTGEVWTEFWTVSETNPQGELSFRKKIQNADPKDQIIESSSVDFSDSVIVYRAAEQFKASKLKAFFFGEVYRSSWTAPVPVNVFDIKTEKGGLTAISLGGGMQTKSLRLADASGKEYVLRSIQKDPTRKFLPADMQNTLAGDIMRDQISMSHPYGAFTIAPLAEAAGVNYKTPKLVYVPDDPRLGKFRSIYGNTLALFEERASKKIKNDVNFGNVKKAISTPNMVLDLQKSNHNVVDEYEMLRARLFDMLIGDFDRHDDQWRWALHQCKKNTHDHCYHTKDSLTKKGNVYVPIPRDRDQVFAKVDGLITSIAAMPFSPGQLLTNFDHKVKDFEGLNLNGRQLDVSFLTRLTEKDWIAIANEMQVSVTDEVIEKAIRQLPDTIFNLNGNELIEKLKSRRDDLHNYAVRHYKIIAKNIEVVGSNESETFEILRMPNGNVDVKVYRRTKKKNKRSLFYHREFKYKETREINLYGLGSKDRFEISGNVKKSILIRIISGKGQDEIIDQSAVRGFKKYTRVYDKVDGAQIAESSETKDLTSNDKYLNTYNRERFKANKTIPLVKFGYNIDDGVYLGGGVSLKRHAWRKAPFASTHEISGIIAVKTGSFSLSHNSTFYQAVKKWNLNIKTEILAPNAVTNFYGLGNDTKDIAEDLVFNRVRYNHGLSLISFEKNVGKSSVFSIGPKYEFIQTQQSVGRFISSDSSGLKSEDFEENHLFGLETGLFINTTNSKVQPSNGLKWNINANAMYNLSDDTYLSAIKSDIAFYIPIKSFFSPVLALRFGGSTILGDFLFNQANTLGAQSKQLGSGNLRGYRRDRFAGRSSAFQNTDLRLKLTSFTSYLFPGDIGIHGFVDNGRVWMDGEDSNTWHTSYGGGIWVSPFHTLLIATTFEKSIENNIISFHMNFLF
jgi:hypothetical protein